MLEKEKQANELYKRLLEVLANSISETNISINKPGLHWSCAINRNDRNCIVYCFGQKGYYVSFRIDDKAQAHGRTCLKEELILSVVKWIIGASPNDIRDEFNFIDPGKRALEIFWDLALQVSPELEHCTNIILKRKLSEAYCLSFTSSQRNCEVYIERQTLDLTFEFYWGDFSIFKFSSKDNARSALILKRWFSDNVIPSVLVNEFPWLNSDRLSKYNDFDQIIADNFSQSWDDFEKTYNWYLDIGIFGNENYYEDIIKMISKMRQKGFDRTLRAGHSMFRLMLSRSLYHGLHQDQAFLIFDFSNGSISIFSSRDANSNQGIILNNPKIELTPQIEKLLKELEAEEIN
jgi:hypothetical protein